MDEALGSGEILTGPDYFPALDRAGETSWTAAMDVPPTILGLLGFAGLDDDVAGLDPLHDVRRALRQLQDPLRGHAGECSLGPRSRGQAPGRLTGIASGGSTPSRCSATGSRGTSHCPRARRARPPWGDGCLSRKLWRPRDPGESAAG